ncbi:MAG: cytosolic protein [Candidatus Rokubacteria bacterium]|nr:cytosolic protein [Candidatus Rokubacteria bacterium]
MTLPRDGDRRVIDFHVHVGPELLARRYDVGTLADEAEAAGFGAVLKHHSIATAPLAALARARGAVMAGGVVLNHGVGAFNPAAVDALAEANKANPGSRSEDAIRAVVWMPTVHAESHLRRNARRDFVPAWGVDPARCREFPPGGGLGIWAGGPDEPGPILPAVRAVLDRIAAHDLVLATGHLSRGEVLALVDAAVATGIRRIVVTHAFYQATSLTIDDQVRLAAHPAVCLEYCWSNIALDHIPLDRYVDAIRAVGPAHALLSSDLGQPSTETVAEGLGAFHRSLVARGIPEDHVAEMMIANPHRLLDVGGPEMAPHTPQRSEPPRQSRGGPRFP